MHDDWVAARPLDRGAQPVEIDEAVLAGDEHVEGRVRGFNLQHAERAIASFDAARRLASDVEQAEVLALSEKLYIGYRKYQSRITGRRLRVFVLERSPG